MKLPYFARLMLVIHLINSFSFINAQSIEQNNSKEFHFPKSQVAPEIQENTVRDLLKRKFPKKYDFFVVSVDPSLSLSGKDVFRISSPYSHNDTRVGITASSGVPAAWGILHYLKYYCNAHISWQEDKLEIPDPLPKAQVKITANDRFRYYGNVCTSSYSFAWWSWSQWESHIDWMALNGINFPLAFIGQEAIWRNVYLKMNFSEEDLNRHFAGPGFLAWGRMGNIQAWGGPLSSAWHKRTLNLQKSVLKRMRNFGMAPILPAFAGHVPDAIARIFPDVSVKRIGYWSNFQDPRLTNTLLLDPLDPLFHEIGSRFIKEMISEFNYTDHYYNCDAFNENPPPNKDTHYIRNIGNATMAAMLEADPHAIWVMQGWLFRDDYWVKPLAKSLLTSVPIGRMIVLDLMGETYPQYSRLESFYGQPFVFCMLHNFGGINGFYGNVDILLQHLKAVRQYPNVTIVGTGLTPEGINQNYVMYDLMLEFAWRKPTLDVNEWVRNYSIRRYGNYSQELLGDAWNLLMKSVYNSTMPISFHGATDLLSKRPSLTRKVKLWYDPRDVVEAWKLFIEASQQCVCELNETNPIGCLNCQQTFQHDLVDITRQVLQKHALRSFISGITALQMIFKHIPCYQIKIYGTLTAENIRVAYKQNNTKGIKLMGRTLMSIMDDMETILGSSKDFLLGTWLKDAKAASSDEQEEIQFVSNALHQITLWGPNGEIIDYAAKQWAGVFMYYKKPRWELFLKSVLEALNKGEKFDKEMFKVEVFNSIEKPFATNTNRTYPVKPKGNSVKIANDIYQKYTTDIGRLFNGRRIFGNRKLI